VVVYRDKIRGARARCNFSPAPQPSPGDAQECMWPTEYKQRAVESTELDTVVINRWAHRPPRAAPPRCISASPQGSRAHPAGEPFAVVKSYSVAFYNSTRPAPPRADTRARGAQQARRPDPLRPERPQSGPKRGGHAFSAFPTVNLLSMVLVYGRAGRLTALFGGSRPGAVIEAAAIEDSKLEGEFKIQDVFPLIAGTRGRQARAHAAQGDAAIWAEMTAMASMSRPRADGRHPPAGREGRRPGRRAVERGPVGRADHDIPTVAELVQVNAVPL
jgi:hypothetical protein